MSLDLTSRSSTASLKRWVEQSETQPTVPPSIGYVGWVQRSETQHSKLDALVAWVKQSVTQLLQAGMEQVDF